MKVFLSWSGEVSKNVANELRGWLPDVIQQLEPWMSSEDIPKGARWLSEISRELEDGAHGVVCLTPDNIDRPWINFEAGALAGKAGETRVCTVLFDVSNADITGPLATFQSTPLADQGEVFKLVRDLNASLGPQALLSERLRRSFDANWPRLQNALDEIRSDQAKPVEVKPSRSDRELLEELLEMVREQVSRSTTPEQVSPDTFDDSPWAPAVVLNDGSRVIVGNAVRHKEFGRGTIKAVGGSAARRVILVAFNEPEVGTKKLLVDYAPLVSEEPPF